MSVVLSVLGLLSLNACKDSSVANTTLIPVPASFYFTKIVTSSQDASFSCGIGNNQKLYCWGVNTSGQLGIGDLSVYYKTRPVPVSTVTGLNQVVDVQLGSNFACALNINHLVYCWGANNLGQVGIGATMPNIVSAPVLVGGNAGFSANQISVGDAHACALDSGTAYCWGDNTFWQLGTHQAMSYSAEPVPVDNSILTSPILIRAGYVNTCAIDANHKAYCWGDDHVGQLGTDTMVGTGTSVPVQVTDETGLSQVSDIQLGGFFNVCATRTDGSVYCWGDDTFNQIGNADPDNLPVLAPYQVLYDSVPLLSNSLKVGGYNVCAIVSLAFYATKPTALCWGDNTNGQIYGNTDPTVSAPVILPFNTTNSSFVSDIHPSLGYMCESLDSDLQTNIQHFCQGLNNFGQLGDGTIDNSINPQPILNPMIF
jgi:alpha-tubulin suppressor-like RCC1 family protein